MSLTDNLLQSKYKKMVDLDNINNISNNSLFSGDISYLSNIFISGNSFQNNINLTSSLNINNYFISNYNSILSNLYINNSLGIYDKNNINKTLNINNSLMTNSLYVDNNVVNNNNTTLLASLNIGNNFNSNTINTNNIGINNNNINLYGSTIIIGTNNSIVNIFATSTYVATNKLNTTDKLFQLNINASTLSAFDIGNNSGIEILNTSLTGFIQTSTDATRYIIKAPTDSNIKYILTQNNYNNLIISGTTLLKNNVSILSSLFVLNNFQTNNISINSNLYNSNNYLIGNNLTCNSDLYIKTLFINNAATIMSSLFINNNYNTYNKICKYIYISSYNSLYDTNIINLNINNNLFINTANINNFIVNNNLLVNNTTSLLSNLNINNNAIYNKNVSISSNLLISGNTIFSNNISINSLLTNGNVIFKGNNSIIGTINIQGQIINPLLEFQDNQSAIDNGLKIGSWYRTGGILKMVVGSIIINGPKIITQNINTPYYEYGVIISNDTFNYLNVITLGTVNTSLIGTYYINYNITANIDNYLLTRTIIIT